ncbi:glutaminyl-peptide cyclotransferase [Caulobacter mirabilis]|uniref:Glutamine cyclotransferase n=1 Tax=Caulobacter mirabilis TaxID=69666 RepID=A0A2D2AXF8_9CAUL|nr:glutaminyl-peptide cyclotransferase [Caulobacter mirabilis]ATQ42655.1 glutamine cyclotransferase [Caulobacter mirabilis]
MRRLLLFLIAAAFLAPLPAAAEDARPVPGFGYQVLNRYPHDREAFTQGLFWREGVLYESTGLVGRSSIRKVELTTGKVLQRRDTDPQQFGEGIVDWEHRLVQLTWLGQKGYVYDVEALERTGQFSYVGQGWGLTRDDRRIIMSDGTADLRFLDPLTLKETGRITVKAGDQPIHNLNELEWIEGEVWANVWQTHFIARIDPGTGQVVGWIDLSGLLSAEEARGVDVLNGIAYDREKKRIFVTGKLWPTLFEIRIVPKD